MEAIGTQIRRHRLRLGLTLDELAGRTAISKPYLSLIETGRVPNPPSDQKLRRLEQALGFPPGQLLTQAHLQRTPRDVRAVLQKLMARADEASASKTNPTSPTDNSPSDKTNPTPLPETPSSDKTNPTVGCNSLHHPVGSASADRLLPLQSSPPLPIDLDDAYLSGVLQELVDRSAGNVEQVASNAVPIINKVSAGYPRDFTDLQYPKGVADDYVSCPDLQDHTAFAARVHGDSMMPKYREGDIVIFSPAAPMRNGDDCFVRFADAHTTFKRVFFESDESGAPLLRLQPRNERYRPQTIPSEQVTGLYKAVFKYQRVDED